MIHFSVRHVPMPGVCINMQTGEARPFSVWHPTINLAEFPGSEDHLARTFRADEGRSLPLSVEPLFLETAFIPLYGKEEGA